MANTDAVSSSGGGQKSPELRIVLIGGRELTGQPSHKSATGNIILGKDVFDTSKRTAQSVARQREVHGRHVTVVDTPGWWWHYPVENTPKLDRIEIENSVHLCPPGPHVFLLVVPVYLLLPKIFKESLEEHLKLFQGNVFNHTIVLFTAPPAYSEKYIETNMWPALQWVLQQCGNRKHTFVVSNSEDSVQVKRLFDKIEALVAENRGCHFSVDSSHGQALRAELNVLSDRASKRTEEMQTQRRKLRAMLEGDKKPPVHLRLVMVGAQWSGKSSAGNTILGKYAFAVSHGRTTEICEMYHSMVAGKQLTVVDSPGWLYNHTLQDTTETDKLEIRSSMSLCPQGPHAVLLVVGLAAAFNASCHRALLDHMDLFGHEIWNHTIVLFTRGDWLGVKTVEERIASEGGLEWLVNKCGNRYHVLNNMDTSDEIQVKELLEKIEEMWAGNKNPQYEPDNAIQMEAGKMAVEATAKRLRQIAQRQARVLRELFEGEMQPVTDIKIILIGRKESGKSTAGNMLLFKEIFDMMLGKKEFQKQRRNATCVKHQRNMWGMNVSVVETPGWIADTTPPSWIRKEVLSSVSMCAPGPDVFLLVVPVCKAYTEKDHNAVLELLTPFKEGVWRHCMVLFTWGDWLNRRTIEDHITGEGKFLQRLVEQCGNRYHVLNCGHSGHTDEISGLLSKIHDMITVNKGQCFTSEKTSLFRKVKKATLTEEEWNRREQTLIDRMLRALDNEPKEPTLPPAKVAGSFDGAFLPSLSGDPPLLEKMCHQGSLAKVLEWRTSAGYSDVSSGLGSYVEENHLTDDNLQQ